MRNTVVVDPGVHLYVILRHFTGSEGTVRLFLLVREVGVALAMILLREMEMDDDDMMIQEVDDEKFKYGI